MFSLEGVLRLDNGAILILSPSTVLGVRGARLTCGDEASTAVTGSNGVDGRSGIGLNELVLGLRAEGEMA